MLAFIHILEMPFYCTLLFEDETLKMRIQIPNKCNSTLAESHSPDWIVLCM